MGRFFRTLLVLLCLAPVKALAVLPSEILADPKLEARARAISAELRCLVCQNQSIDDSNAPLAKDLRLIVRERLKAGDTDPQVLSFVVARYGDFILLKPPLNAGTVLLWVSPFVVLILGAGFVLLAARRRRLALPAVAALSPDEAAKLSAILDKKSP
jgi:cytochrome c-type biogenesis protein CcmH